MKRLIIILIAISIGALCFAAGERIGNQRLNDVPKDHWAASAVQKLSENGVITGYPDYTFRGDRPVTRYELAVALARFAEFIEAGRADLIRGDKKTDVTMKNPECPEWARNSFKYLTDNMFLENNSPIITDGSKRVTGEDLAQAFSTMTARIIELEVSGTGSGDEL